MGEPGPTQAPMLKSLGFPRVFDDFRGPARRVGGSGGAPSGHVVKLHLDPWRMKKCSVFDVFRDVVYGCPSYKILTKVRIGKDCIFRGYRFSFGNQGCSNTPAQVLVKHRGG